MKKTTHEIRTSYITQKKRVIMIRYIKWVECIAGIPGSDAGGPSLPLHIKCGGGRSGLTMGSGGGRESGRAGQARKIWTTPKRPILRG